MEAIEQKFQRMKSAIVLMRDIRAKADELGVLVSLLLVADGHEERDLTQLAIDLRRSTSRALDMLDARYLQQLHEAE